MNSAEATMAVDPKDYNALVARARLESVTLVVSGFEMKPKDDGGEPWHYEIAEGLPECGLDEDLGRIHGLYSYRVRCLQGRRKMLSVNATYSVVYAVVEGRTDEASCALFMRKVGRFAAYPYFRALFASLSGQANLPLPPLPVISDQPYRIPAVADGGTHGTRPVTKAAARRPRPAKLTNE